MALRFLTAGESHGPGLTAILEGVPSGLDLDAAAIDAELARRQRGHGRGGRMKIERDRAVFTSGVRHGRTLGSPIAIHIDNLDHAAWRDVLAPFGPPPDPPRRVVTAPRPGHADLAGGTRHRAADLRDILERASARETAARVALGAIAKPSWSAAAGSRSTSTPRATSSSTSRLRTTGDAPRREQGEPVLLE